MVNNIVLQQLVCLRSISILWYDFLGSISIKDYCFALSSRPKLPAALNYSALLPVSVQSITHYSAY